MDRFLLQVAGRGEVVTLRELFEGIPGAVISGSDTAEVKGLSADSRGVSSGDLYVALRGSRVDGNSFVAEAVRRGAAAVASEEKLPALGLPSVLLPDPRRWIGELSSRAHGYPGRRMRIVGITGTNGKTTTAHLVEAILARSGRNPAFVGTVGYRWNGVTREAPRTTPESWELHSMLAEMATDGVSDVVMECSSHALEMGRLNGLDLDVAVFTNLTRDHLDFHGTTERYRDAKRKLFVEVLAGSRKETRTSVLNLDDPIGRAWSGTVGSPEITVSTIGSSRADLHPLRSDFSAAGIRAEVSVRGRSLEICSPLVGEFNLANLLAAMAVAEALEVPRESTVAAIAEFGTVPGRLERVPNRRGIHVFVDYAHTDDALDNVLRSLRPFADRRLLVVFGCGGDRDRGKRPKMAAAAARYGDVTIVTSDNPRGEDPERIIGEIVEGIPAHVRRVKPEDLNEESRGVACSMAERRAAIERALSIARGGDVVLIAGKGHETYQEVGGIRHPFDDRAVASGWLEGGK
jgi:UDP-N-acetylmuramoyl-L-alanyl-D-glutamate--2,6-diaminopimelate ligase